MILKVKKATYKGFQLHFLLRAVYFWSALDIVVLKKTIVYKLASCAAFLFIYVHIASGACKFFLLAGRWNVVECIAFI